MVDINQVYDNGWLKAAHLQGRDAKLTIESVTTADFKDRNGNTKTQLVLRFVGKKLPLGLNITNAKTIAKNLKTTESAAWIGKQITLYPTVFEGPDGQTPCIRIRSTEPVAPVYAAPKSENPAEAMSDEIPF